MGALALPGPRHRDEPNPMLLADHRGTGAVRYV